MFQFTRMTSRPAAFALAALLLSRAGLRGHTVAAVYALLDSNYKRGSPGWEHVRHVSITRDLAADLAHFLSQKGPKEVAHLRALSFSYPQKAVMEDFAAGWRAQVTEAGGSMGDWGAVPKDAGGAAEAATIMAGDAYRPDEDEDEDEDDGDDDDLDHEDEDDDEDDGDDDD